MWGHAVHVFEVHDRWQLLRMELLEDAKEEQPTRKLAECWFSPSEMMERPPHGLSRCLRGGGSAPPYAAGFRVTDMRCTCAAHTLHMCRPPPSSEEERWLDFELCDSPAATWVAVTEPVERRNRRPCDVRVLLEFKPTASSYPTDVPLESATASYAEGSNGERASFLLPREQADADRAMRDELRLV